LWKYGGRLASARSTGPLKRPTSFQRPVINARPGSVVCTVSNGADVWRSVYSGMSGVRREPSAMPMSSGAGIE